jgi:hypothetical protein
LKSRAERITDVGKLKKGLLNKLPAPSTKFLNKRKLSKGTMSKLEDIWDTIIAGITSMGFRSFHVRRPDRETLKE